MISTALDINAIAGSPKTSIIQCLHATGITSFGDQARIADETMPLPAAAAAEDHEDQAPPTDPVQVGASLESIPEETGEEYFFVTQGLSRDLQRTQQGDADEVEVPLHPPTFRKRTHFM